MKQIKANHLKWCEYGFKFTFCEKEYKFKAFNLNENIEVSPVELDGFNLIVGHPPHLEVSVDETEYKANVIEKIVSIFDEVVTSVVKHSGQVFVNTDDYDGNTKHIAINIDPQPWSEEYQIEVR